MNRCEVAAMRLFMEEVAWGVCDFRQKSISFIIAIGCNGVLAGKVVWALYDFKREIGHIPQQVYLVM